MELLFLVLLILLNGASAMSKITLVSALRAGKKFTWRGHRFETVGEDRSHLGKVLS